MRAAVLVLAPSASAAVGQVGGAPATPGRPSSEMVQRLARVERTTSPTFSPDGRRHLLSPAASAGPATPSPTP